MTKSEKLKRLVREATDAVVKAQKYLVKLSQELEHSKKAKRESSGFEEIAPFHKYVKTRGEGYYVVERNGAVGIMVNPTVKYRVHDGPFRSASEARTTAQKVAAKKRR